MGDRLDSLLGELAFGSDFHVPEGLEAAVWRRVDAREAGRSQFKASVVLQCAVGACALVTGFSYQACQQQSPQATSREPAPFLRLLDGSTVTEAGFFQVLQ